MTLLRVKTTRNPLPPSPDFVSMREVAAYCCVSVAAVSQGLKNNTWPYRLLRPVRIGRRLIFTRASFNHMGREMKRRAEVKPDDVLAIEDGRRKSA